MIRWQQVWALWQAGWSVPRIARVLDISEANCRAALVAAEAHAARGQAMVRREAQAWLCAQPYTDERAKRWIYRQMGVAWDEGMESPAGAAAEQDGVSERASV